MREGRILPPRVIGDAMDAEPKDERNPTVTRLMLRVISRKVADGEREEAVCWRLDVLHQSREMTEVLPCKRALRYVGAIDEVDLVSGDIAVKEMVPRRVVRSLIARDHVAAALLGLP